MRRIFWVTLLLVAAPAISACGSAGGASTTSPAGASAPSPGQEGSGKAQLSGSASASPTGAGETHTAPALASLEPCNLLPLDVAQSLTPQTLDSQQHLSEAPATRSAGCAWFGSQDATVDLNIWENPPTANDYNTQLAEAEYLATAKRCPGAYYRVIPGLGDSGFASYCTTDAYDTNNEQTVTWQYGDLLLSISIASDSTAEDRISKLTAVAGQISSQL